MSPGETTDTDRPRPKRSLRRRALKVLLRLMRREESLERVAAAVAVGVGVGLSPFIGFHFFLAIAIALLFRLNKLDTVLGSLVGNPWTLPPFYALGYRVGRAILGFAPARVPPLRWQRILHHDFWVSFRGPGFGPRLSSFLVGTTLLASLIGLGDVPRAARGARPLSPPASARGAARRPQTRARGVPPRPEEERRHRTTAIH